MTESAPQRPTMRLEHVSIHVGDFDRALAWYKSVLGFEEEVVWQVAALGGKRLAYLGLPGAAARIELVACGGAHAEPPANFPAHFEQAGYGHFCLAVDDVDGAMAAVGARGAPAFVAAATYPLDGTPFRRRVAFIKDPEGNVVELAGPLEASGDAR